jgi:hypothetical protein
MAGKPTKPTKQPNVPKLLRASLNARFEKKERLKEAAAAVPALYGQPGSGPEERPTRKGTWKVFKQHDYSAPSFVGMAAGLQGSGQGDVPAGEQGAETDGIDRFCALYYREGRPRTIIRGNTADDGKINGLLAAVSGKILEQRPLFSRPAKTLTEENGLSYGIRTGLIFAVLLALFVLFDYVLIPNYPETILQAANITTGEEVYNYAADAKIFQYKSVTGEIVGTVFPEKYRRLSTSMYTLAVAFILPILIFGIVYEAAGKGADRRRVKRFPPGAFGFQYGLPAAEAILAEAEQVKREKLKADLYERLSEYGLSIDRASFEKIIQEIIEEAE